MDNFQQPIDRSLVIQTTHSGFSELDDFGSLSLADIRALNNRTNNRPHEQSDGSTDVVRRREIESESLQRMSNELLEILVMNKPDQFIGYIGALPGKIRNQVLLDVVTRYSAPSDDHPSFVVHTDVGTRKATKPGEPPGRILFYDSIEITQPGSIFGNYWRRSSGNLISNRISVYEGEPGWNSDTYDRAAYQRNRRDRQR